MNSTQGLPPKQRLFYRSLTYLQTGISYAGLPLALVGLSGSFYSDVVAKVPFLREVFPRYYIFLIFGLVVGGLLLTAFGWWFVRRSHFYKEQQKIAVLSSPFATTELTPKEVLGWRMNYTYGKVLGVDPKILEDIKELLAMNGVVIE